MFRGAVHERLILDDDAAVAVSPVGGGSNGVVTGLVIGAIGSVNDPRPPMSDAALAVIEFIIRLSMDGNNNIEKNSAIVNTTY